MVDIKNEDELQLLAKLEEQNRSLLSDSKAVPSLVRRQRDGSFSSSVSNGSEEARANGQSTAFQNGSAAPKSNSSSTVSLPVVVGWSAGAPVNAPIQEQWVYVVNNWEQFSKRKTYVNDLIRKGVPDELRSLFWQLYTGAYDAPVKKLYQNYLENESPVEKAIRRDIARTFPKHDMFKDENGCGQESLYRVIKAYSIHDREVGYCQGSAFIVGLLLMQMHELDAFAVLVQLMNDYRLREMYKPSMTELGICMYQLEQLISDYLPDLYAHFRTQSFAPSLYASAWFLTLFSTCVPIPMATRIMDFYIAEGIYFIFKLALAILKFSSEILLRCDMESMVAYLQHEGPNAWEIHASAIFESAFSFKLNSKKMKKLEKEYQTIQSQEREEQIELRRLRTENGLLLQRLTRLEEESSVMADRLVQCQLLRAQEAEVMTALRCELSILRRHNAKSQTTASQSYDDDQLLANGESSPKIVNGVNHDDSAVPNENSSTERSTNKSKTSTLTPSLADLSTTPKQHSDLNPLQSTDSDEESSLSTTRHHSLEPSIVSRLATYKVNSTRLDADSENLILRILHQVQSDLANSRLQEADARTMVQNLKDKVRELEESKSDQAARSAEQISVLKDELFTVKLRETEALSRLEELRSHLDELDALWTTHLNRCKGVNSDSKRGPLRLPTANADSSEKLKFTDRLLETRLVNQIASLKQQISDLTVQQELSDRRADRLDQRVTELLDARSCSQARERQLAQEIKQLVQKCAEIEYQRKSDGIMWRSREMELAAQLIERRQCYLQLECQYESLLTSKRLEDNVRMDASTISNGDPEPSSSARSDKHYTLGSYLNSGSATTTEHRHQNGHLPDSVDPSLPRKQSTTLKQPHRDKASHSSVASVWKDIPACIMTDSMGPLEELCLVPDDPLVTSVYMDSATKC